MNDQLDRIEKLIKEEKTEEAMRIFKNIEAMDSVKYFMVKGMIEQKYQNWSDAINAFSKVLEIDPENVEAKNNLHIVQNILNFWNPDMFNP